MLTHGYVPDAFGSGIIIPVLKDKNGDKTLMDNYRPITLGAIISKVFEWVLLFKYSHLMRTDDLQFGFKSGSSCSTAILLLRRVIEHYNMGGSNVFIASIDACKAFDRLNHYKLYSTIIRAGLPRVFVDVVISWYSKLNVVIRWNANVSSSLHVLSGVRQGGVLSPTLFNLYVNCFLVKLRNSKLGCFLNGLYAGSLMYADDLILLSASAVQLQKMLNMCVDISNDLDLKFNCVKSNCLFIGPNKGIFLTPMQLGVSDLVWADKIKYLGITIMSSKRFTVDFTETRRKFFIAVNSIISKCKYASELVKLHLIETHCLPILLYAVESLNLSRDQIAILNSWWNTVYRKLFGYNRWESVRMCICMLQRLDLVHLLVIRRIMFFKRILQSNLSSYNIMVLHEHGSLCREIIDLQRCHMISIRWCTSKLWSTINDLFRSTCM
jgi:hypothetical protein